MTHILFIRSSNSDSPRDAASRLREDQESGQSLTEYVLLILPIALVAMAILLLMGDSLKNAYCSVTEGFAIIEGEPCYEVLSDVGSGPIILRSKFRDASDGIGLMAKASGCAGDIAVVGHGVMTRKGSSDIYAHLITDDPPPQSVTIGSDSCGWTTVTFD